MLSYQVCWKKFENVIEVRLKLSKKTVFFCFRARRLTQLSVQYDLSNNKPDVNSVEFKTRFHFRDRN